ncbi:MAG: type II toxin-antitoxin system ParD family antitoxin [Pseudomonadota bacterium]
MATKNTSVALSDHNLEFIHQEVSSGRFASTSEVIRDALRLAAERKMKIEALREALIEGEQSGPAREFDWDEFMKRRFGSTNDDAA